MKKETNIIHVEFKSGGDHYFGSIAAIYETFDADTLGITRASLYNFGLAEGKPYKNKVCTITRGKLHRKAGDRCEHSRHTSL